jgi:hypothetical protein
MLNQATNSIQFGFDLPFVEQAEFFRNKKIVPTKAWDDLKLSEHDHGFMVAGAIKADLLNDLKSSIQKAIDTGSNIETFRKDFNSIVQKHGWTGWKGSETEKGRAWRTRIIYETNLATSYSAGRYQQLIEAEFPYWIYRHNDSVRNPRLQHKAWNGLTLPANHRFWKSHFPINAFGCKCYVIGTDKKETAKQYGGEPTKPLPEDWDSIDPKTGAPMGIGKGFNYAPGSSNASTIKAIREKLPKLPYQIAKALIQDTLATVAFAQWLQKPDSNDWPLAVIPEQDAQSLGSKITIATLSHETYTKQLRVHAELTAAEYRQAQNVIDNPTNKVKDGDYSYIYYKVIEDAKSGGYVLVVKTTKTGEGLFVTSYRRLSRDEARRDQEIERLLKKGG